MMEVSFDSEGKRVSLEGEEEKARVSWERENLSVHLTFSRLSPVTDGMNRRWLL